MKAVLLSIQPYYVFLIIARTMGWNIPQEKKVDVRKDCPKDNEWNKETYIYCTQNRKSFSQIPKQYQPLMEKLMGKVIGKFVCDRIEGFDINQLFPLGEFKKILQQDLERFLKASCLSYDELCDYFKDMLYFESIYGWHISDLKIYDKPKDLSEFKRACKQYAVDNPICEDCSFEICFRGLDYNKSDCAVDGLKPLTRPPQSWYYVEV